MSEARQTLAILGALLSSLGLSLGGIGIIWGVSVWAKRKEEK